MSHKGQWDRTKNHAAARATWDRVFGTVEWIFTFGHGHPFFPGYHIIRARSGNEARGLMFRRFGKKWAFQYSIDRLTEIQQYQKREIIIKRCVYEMRMQRSQEDVTAALNLWVLARDENIVWLVNPPDPLPKGFSKLEWREPPERNN